MQVKLSDVKDTYIFLSMFQIFDLRSNHLICFCLDVKFNYHFPVKLGFHLTDRHLIIMAYNHHVFYDSDSESFKLFFVYSGLTAVISAH